MSHERSHQLAIQAETAVAERGCQTLDGTDLTGVPTHDDSLDPHPQPRFFQCADTCNCRIETARTAHHRIVRLGVRPEDRDLYPIRRHILEKSGFAFVNKRGVREEHASDSLLRDCRPDFLEVAPQKWLPACDCAVEASGFRKLPEELADFWNSQLGRRTLAGALGITMHTGDIASVRHGVHDGGKLAACRDSRDQPFEELV